jgi:hypothetical protein
MPSSWVARRKTRSGVRHRVMFRVGGRESASRYAGSFRTLREAAARKRRVDGELAAMRVPDLSVLAEAPKAMRFARPRRSGGRVGWMSAKALVGSTGLRSPA